MFSNGGGRGCGGGVRGAGVAQQFHLLAVLRDIYPISRAAPKFQDVVPRIPGTALFSAQAPIEIDQSPLSRPRKLSILLTRCSPPPISPSTAPQTETWEIGSK